MARRQLSAIRIAACDSFGSRHKGPVGRGELNSRIPGILAVDGDGRGGDKKLSCDLEWRCGLKLSSLSKMMDG